MTTLPAGDTPLVIDSLSLVPQAAVTALLFGMIFALVAAGLALIWGVADIVNFAHGEYMLVAMYVTLFASNTYGIDPLFLIPVNAVLLFVAGYATYRLVIAKVIEAPMLAQIFATFALLLIIRYGILYLAGPYTVNVESFMFEGNTRIAGLVVPHPELVTAVVSVFALGGLFVFLKTTRTGKAIRATSQDWEVARVMGIDTDRTFAITWGLGIAAVGVAGTLVATFQPVQPELTPTTWTLIAFASVALGGFGSVLGAVAGGVVIAFVEHLGAVLLDPSFKEMYVFLVFIGALLFKPEGILNWGDS
jgi:branched-chain amino acid transport system permease protein